MNLESLIVDAMYLLSFLNEGIEFIINRVFTITKRIYYC